MNHKILNDKTLSNVKNRPDLTHLVEHDFEFQPIMPDFAQEIIAERVKKMDDWLMLCLLELGYTGPCDGREIHEFILKNNIKLECKPSRGATRFTQYKIKCEPKKYESMMIVKEPSYNLYYYPAIYEVFKKGEI